MEKIWFTADSHWGHANAIRYDKRPYESVTEMDADLLRRWNETVGSKDVVYHLGDIFMHKRIEDARAVRAQLRKPRARARPRDL